MPVCRYHKGCVTVAAISDQVKPIFDVFLQGFIENIGDALLIPLGSAGLPQLSEHLLGLSCRGQWVYHDES